MKKFKVFIFLLLMISTLQNINCTVNTQRQDCGDTLVCRNGTCGFCIIGGNECLGYPINICKDGGSLGTFCAHKNLFPDVSIYDILALIVILNLKIRDVF